MEINGKAIMECEECGILTTKIVEYDGKKLCQRCFLDADFIKEAYSE